MLGLAFKVNAAQDAVSIKTERARLQNDFMVQVVLVVIRRGG